MLNYLLVSLLLITFSCSKSGGTNPKAPQPPEISVPIIEPPIPIPPEPAPIPPVVECPEPPVIVPTPVPEPIPPTSEVPPDRASTFKVNVSFRNATAAQIAKYQKAIGIFKKVIASKDFKDRVLASTYNGASGFASSARSPAYVYDNLLDGDEIKSPAVDNELDVEVRFYYENSTVVGYTSASWSYIYVNTKFFNMYKPSSVAGNLMHEYMHKLGYGHDVSATTRRPSSVPYKLGSIMSSLGVQFN